MKFLSDILAKAGLTVDGVVTLNNTATGQTPDANDNSTKLATTAWVRTFVQPYSLPIASASVLGGVKVGSGLSINSSTGVLSVTGGGAASIKSTQTFIATAGQTVFTISGGYTAGLIDVFLNGVYLSPNQTTATNGTTVTLSDAALVGDIIDVIIASPIYQGATTTTDQLPEGVVNLYYTDARSRAAISLTVTGSSGASTYNSTTGVLNIPTYTLNGLGGVASSRTITINGVTYDLTANRSWSAIPTGGTAGQLLAKVDGTDYNAQWINEAPAASYTQTVKHEVKAGEAITKGQAVYVSSSDGTNMIVSKASNAAEGTSSKTLGLLETTVSTNGFTNVITEGLLTGLNTATANAGDPVWLGTGGNLLYGLPNKPSAPSHLVFIGVVTRANANNGEIFVKVQNGFELGELHDYVQNGVQDNYVISYEYSTSLYKPKSIATLLGYTPANAARTLTINGTAYDLSADRSWSVGTVTSVAALTIGNTGTDITSTVVNSTTTPVITLNIPDASAYSRGVITTGTQTIAGGKYFSDNVAIGHTSPFDVSQFSLDVNGGLLVKNSSKTAQFVLINSNPALGGNNAFVVHTVGGSSGTSYADIQGYYGTSIAGSTVLRLNPQGGNVLIGNLAGTGSRMVVASATGVLSTQAIQTLSDLSGVPTSRTITINGTSYDLSADRSWILTTSNISEGTNLYYTNARARAAISVTGSGSYDSATGIITVTGGVTSVNTLTGAVTLTTTNIGEGTNLYYTTARVNSDFDTRLATKSTTNLAEGTNLYYTDARVGSYLSTNSYATQSYVATQIANLVASAPAALDTLNELAAALGNDASFSTTVSTALGNRLRVDVGTQGLTSTQQGYGRTNLGLGSLATLSSIGNSYITDLAYSKLTGVPTSFTPSAHTHVWADITDRPTNLSAFTNGPGYITGYTETDTLASVTGRGASTSTNVTFNGTLTSAGQTVLAGAFRFYTGGTDGSTAYGDFRTNPATGNSIISAKSNALYFNYDHGTGGVIFCDGATGIVATVSAAGVAVFNGNVTGASFIKSGGTSSQFLKADGSVDSNTYLTGITSSQVTTALGYTPYNSTNPSGYITSSGNISGYAMSLNGYANQTEYIILTGPANGPVIKVRYDSATANRYIDIGSKDGNGVYSEGLKIYNGGTLTFGGNTIWHQGNLTNLNQLSNGPGYLTSITSSQVITALGYTPYNGSTNPNGYITGVTNISGYSNNLVTQDIRTISPSTHSAGRLNFGFTSWANNNTANYADYIHLRSYTDSSGGADNLIMFLKSGIGMRIWQQTWGSSTAYSSYVDVLHSSNYNSYSPTLTGGGASGTWGINVTGSSRSLLFSGDSTKQITDGQWAGGGSYPGYVFTGGNSRFGFSSTSGVIDVYTDGNFYATDSSYLVWHQGNLTNLNQLTNGPGYISAGSTLTGYVNTANGDFAIVNSTSGTGTNWIGRTGVKNSSGDKAVFLGTYNSYAIVGAHNYALNAWADLLVNCVDNSGSGGTTRLSASSYVGSNVILHAGNYSSYAIGYTSLSGSFGLNDNKLYLRTNGDNNHFLWNADDDWEELRYYTGTGFRIQGSTGSVPAYFTNAGIYAAAFRGKDNVAGTGEAVYAPAGLYSTGNNWLYGTMYQNGNIIRDNGGIVQNSIVGYPNAQWGATGATGPVIISFPGNTGNYGMIHAVIDIYEYSGNNVCTIIVGGHNWGGSQWYNYGAQVIGYTDKPVRVGIKDGRYCIIIGNSGSSWSYGQVVLRKIQNGSYYSGIMDVGAGYSVGIGSDSYTWASSDLRDFRTSSSATINGYLTVRGAGTSASIYMSDDDEGQREIHCNSNRIGFLTQAGAWGSWCDDSGNWGVTGSVNAADGSFGTGSSDQGIYINYTNYVSGYGRIRFRQDGSNHSTIHSFSASWQSSSAYAASTGCINIDGQYGTTIGPWNAHHAAITSEGIAIKSSATPSGAMGWNGSAVLRLQQGSTGDNVFLQFRNRADAGDYAGLLFADNNIGGYLGFRTYASNDVANGSDCMIYGTYNDHIFQNGTSGTFNGKTETFRIYGNGSVRATGDVTAYSDARVKENVVTIDKALQKTLQLRGVYYNRTDKDDKSQKIGVIAQEIQQVLPQVVSEDYNGLLSVSYGNLAGIFIEAIKEQQSQIESQKTEIEELKDLVKQLINR